MKRGFSILHLIELWKYNNNIFHELLEPVDSYFTKIFIFYSEASKGNPILQVFRNFLLNDTRFCIDKEQERKKGIPFLFDTDWKCIAVSEEG